jgi:cephalosporin-C deacetylase-like acetyl esterase
MLLSLLLLVTFLFSPLDVGAQLLFEPDRESGVYSQGDLVGWTATLVEGVTPAAGGYTYTIRKNGGEVLATAPLQLTNGRGRIAGSLNEAGMLVVEVRPATADNAFGSRSTGGPGRIVLAAAVNPTGIRPAEPRPADFDEFWAAKIAQLNNVPMGDQVTPGESIREGVDYGTFRLNNINGARIYGQFAKPAREGRFPGLVIFQWAGAPYPLQPSWVTDHAAEGWLALNVMPHDVPSNLPQEFYLALPAVVRNYASQGNDSRDRSYFLQMYLGAYRAIEYLAGRPDWDGETIVVMGTSMGGQQTFAVAGLNPRIDALIVHVPAGADVGASLHGRAASYPGWPVARPEVLETARYFDTSNFAPRITAKSLVSMGFIDDISTPSGIWSVFNQIQGPKETVLLTDAHHNHIATQEQQIPYLERSAEWLSALVRGVNPVR